MSGRSRFYRTWSQARDDPEALRKLQDQVRTFYGYDYCAVCNRQMDIGTRLCSHCLKGLKEFDFDPELIQKALQYAIDRRKDA